MQTRCPFTSHLFYSAYLPPACLPSIRPSISGPSHHADMSACLLWYSGIRFAWSPRSGTNNLFNPLIIIRGINKFGSETAPWTLILYPQLKFIFLPFFSPPFLLLGDKRCLSQCLMVFDPNVQQIHLLNEMDAATLHMHYSDTYLLISWSTIEIDTGITSPVTLELEISICFFKRII